MNTLDTVPMDGSIVVIDGGSSLYLCRYCKEQKCFIVTGSGHDEEFLEDIKGHYDSSISSWSTINEFMLGD